MHTALPPHTSSFPNWAALLLMGLLALFTSSSAQASETIQLNDAALQITDSTIPPIAGEWRHVTLPDEWPMARYQTSDNGWYRFDIPLSQAPTENWGVFVPRLNMNGAVYINDIYVGDSGQFSEPMARNWNRPLYFTIPFSHLKSGSNTLYIRLKSYPGYGLLNPITAGPDAALRPHYDTHALIQNDLNSALVVGTLFAGLFILGIWQRRRTDSMYLWYALMALFWTLYTSNNVIRTIPVSVKTWDWLIYSCIAWWTVTLAIFAHRTAHISRPKLELGFLIWAVLSTLAYALTDLKFISQTTVIWQVGSLVIGFIVVWELLTKSGGRRYVKWLGISMALVLSTGIHDWLIQSGFIPHWLPYTNHILPYSAPLLIFYIGWNLIGRFIKALNETESLNVTLEARVSAAQDELQKNFAERHELEINQAALMERERIYRDLHDDVGAKLLGLAISAERSNHGKEADLARSALQDLRDVVSRSAHATTPLNDLLADLRVETEQRIKATSLRLTWPLPEHESELIVSAESALNISRILRESITNILRHADAQQINVSTTIYHDTLILEVVDDGKGFEHDTVKQHRGMTGMQARATVLSASLAWTLVTPHGCRMTLRIPTQSLPPRNAGV